MDSIDAIAVVGIGCKLPGANNQDEFWKVLVNGENHVIEVPSDRWNINAFYSEDPNTPGKTYVRRAGLLKNHDEFDSKLFNISDIEAERMDPQQRYVLECVHMALEDGGITRKMINGSDTGVFIGFMNDDYKESSSTDLKAMTNYSLTGASPSIIAARVSYVYNLLGPSMAIDTACSSALVAIDVAVQNIKTGRCSMVICGGVNSILTPDLFVPLSRARMVSPTGQCQAFSENADGYARGEGCGIVILKKLGDAKRDGNKIWATIATDCNQDGHTATPITAPSAIQQENLLRRVYESNNVNPQQIQVIEAHGTGTPVGDPIEANTLGRFFGRTIDNSQEDERKVFIASVKTNIGHLESAAGVAGLIKVLLMMKNKTIVPSLHFSVANRKIDFDKYNFTVPSSLIPWKPPPNKPRMACANSFGFGGTNSHVIIKEYPAREYTNRDDSKIAYLVFVSAVDRDGLIAALATLFDQITSTKNLLSDISYTSLCRRDHYQYRKAIIASHLNELKIQCKKLFQTNDIFTTVRLTEPRVVAVFCGVGTTWTGMCCEMQKQYTVVQNIIHKIDTILSQWLDWSVVEVISKCKDLSNPLVAHIAIFTCQVALWTLWMHFEIKIDAVIGQSVGEVAAAYAAGCLTLEQAVEVIYHRSKILANVTGGKMFVVGNCETHYVESVCRQFDRKACIAVYSSSKSCTVSCDADVVAELKLKIKEELPADKRETYFEKDLNVQCAYHSHHTEKAGIELEQSLRHLKGMSPLIPIISTVTGKEASNDDFMSPSYWHLNVSRPVYFVQAVLNVRSSKSLNVFLEIGPKPVLKAHLRDSYKDNDGISLPSMTEKHECDTLLSTIGELFEHGINLNWTRVYKGEGKLCDIPSYVFQPTKKLFISDSRRLKSQGLDTNVGAHLFVERTPNADAMYRIQINENCTPFVFEHFVSNNILVPGAFYAEVALEVGQSFTNNRVQDISITLEFNRPMVLSSGKAYAAEININESDTEGLCGTIRREKDIIARFYVKRTESKFCNNQIDISIIRQKCIDYQSSEQTYSSLRRLGFSYGKNLKILGDSVKNKNQCLVDIHVSDMIWRDVKKTHLHPAILDGLLQTPGVLQTADMDERTLLPAGIGGLSLKRAPERDMLGYAEVHRRSKNEIVYNMLLLTLDGTVIAEVRDFKIKYVRESSKSNSLEYAVVWEEVEIHPMLQDMDRNNRRQSVIICSFDSNILNKMKNKLLEFEVDVCHLDQDTSLESHKHMFASKFQSKSPVTEICFVPGLTIDESFSGQAVMKAIRSTCIVMLAIVQCISKIELPTNVIVITENTQIYNCKNDVNILGTELWGQVRSILRETQSLDIILVDCQPSVLAEIALISKILNINIKNEIGYGELIFAKGKILTNQLRQNSDEEQTPIFRSGMVDENCKIEIKATKPNDLSNTFCILQSDNRIITKNHITLKVNKVCLHHSLVYPTTMPNTDVEFSVFPESCETGFSLISLEVIAIVVNDPTIGKGLVKSDTNDVVVACYPVTVQSLVILPSFCVYPLKYLPGYRPGLVYVSVLMRALIDYVKDGDAVRIMCNTEDQIPEEVLRLLLKTLRQCVVMKSSEEKTSRATTVILLKSYDESDISELIIHDRVTTVIALSVFLSQHNRILLEKKNINVILVHTDEVFSLAKLHRSVPVVFKFLRKHLHEIKTNNRSRENHTSIMQIPSKVMSLQFENIGKYNSVKIPAHALFRKDCCYIVIGGLSGLGWELINLLAENNAGEVISLSRRRVEASIQTKIENISLRTGCRIQTFSTDISNFDDLQATFAKIEQTSNYTIKGIFQGAGILQDTLFSKMNEQQLTDVLMPKVMGTWNLHLVSKQYPLEFFVMHSSMTSVMGNIGQSNYGAANAFLDSLSHYRRRNGYSGQTINWGPLAVGMVKDSVNLEQILKDQGYFPLEITDINECLLKNLQRNSVQVTYGKFDWNLIGKSLTVMKNNRVQKRFDNLVQTENHYPQAIHDGFNDELIEVIQSSAEERLTKLSHIVLRTASEVFSLGIDILNRDTYINELGIDSMQSMTFANRLNDITGVRIPIVTLMSDDTSFETVIGLLNTNLKETHTKVSNVPVIEKSVFCSMTPMEKKSYDAYLFNPFDPSLFSFADLEVSTSIADISVWKQFIQQLHTKHSALRTVFIPDQNYVRYGVRKEVISAFEITSDFRVVPIVDLDHKEKLPQDLKHYLFDPAKDLPMRILYGIDENRCLIRFVFNHLSLDLTSIGILVNDLMSMGQNSPEDLQIQQEIDIAVVFEKRLQQQRSKLELFWKENTPKRLAPMSFKGMSTIQLDPKCFNFTKISLDTQTIRELKSMMSKQNIKLFDFIVSIYQLILCSELQENTVSVFATVDMRIHFPELKKSICRFTNPVPLYAVIDPTALVLSFLKQNKDSITRAVENSLLPFDIIAGFVENLKSSDVFRHQVIMEEVTAMTVQSSEEFKIHVKRVSTGNYYNETVLYVWHDTENNQLDLELAYSTLMVDNSRAKNVLNTFIRFIRAIVTDPDKLISSLFISPETLAPNQGSDNGFNGLSPCQSLELDPDHRKNDCRDDQKHSSMMDELLIDTYSTCNGTNTVTGHFMKQTKRGWDHLVVVELRNNKNEQVLCWGITRNKLNRSLCLKDVRKIERNDINGKFCWHVHAHNRVYVFKTTDPLLIEKFTVALKKDERKIGFAAVLENDIGLF